MNKIPQHIILDLQKEIVGKKIKYGNMVGICDYFGYAFFESWGLQLTICRTPISNVDMTKIEILDV